jgi:TPR repeat protein
MIRSGVAFLLMLAAAATGCRTGPGERPPARAGLPEKACELGNTDACAANELYEKACELDEPTGCLHLANNLSRGDGARQDWAGIWGHHTQVHANPAQP